MKGSFFERLKTYASKVIFAPSGGVTSGNVQDAIEELEAKLDGYVLKVGEVINALGDLAGGTDDIDLTLGHVITAKVSTGTETFTFSNPSATLATSFTLFLINGGSQTVNWPASVDWESGVAPPLTASGMDVLTFVTVDGGTVWYGFTAGLDMQ